MVTWPCGGSLGAKGLSTSWGMGGPERGGTEARLCGTWLSRELYVWGGFHHSVHLSILGDSPDSSCSRATSGWSAEGHKVFTLLARGARAVTHTPRSVLGTERNSQLAVHEMNRTFREKGKLCIKEAGQLFGKPSLKWGIGIDGANQERWVLSGGRSHGSSEQLANMREILGIVVCG